MNVHFRRAAAAMLAGMTLLAAQPSAVSAEGENIKKIVVLGDGISSGAALADRSGSYASLVQEYIGGEIVDLSKDACTTEDLLAELDDPAVQAQLADADVILFTVGIQDIMNPFMEQLRIYKDELGFETLDDLYTSDRGDLAVSDDTLVSYSLVLAGKLEQNEISCRDNILQIGEKLSAYPDAQVICPNVYNCLNTIEGLSEMSYKRQTAYRSIMNPCNFVLSDSVNDSYAKLAENYGFTVIDTFSYFKGLAYKHTNLVNLNINPTASGHRVIAREIAAYMTGETVGELTNDSEINAADANVLLEHAAIFGSDQVGTIPKEKWLFLDLDGDGKTDAADAAEILLYAAAVGAGEDVLPGNS